MSRAVLIVEDDEAIRTSLAEFLEGMGFVVHSAGHGADALDLLKTIDPPAVIVLDLMMPVMNGSEFLAAMRSDNALRGIPVVILSAWTREWTGQSIGVEHVLGKPVDTTLLLDLVTRYCSGKTDGR